MGREQNIISRSPSSAAMERDIISEAKIEVYLGNFEVLVSIAEFPLNLGLSIMDRPILGGI